MVKMMVYHSSNFLFLIIMGVLLLFIPGNTEFWFEKQDRIFIDTDINSHIFSFKKALIYSFLLWASIFVDFKCIYLIGRVREGDTEIFHPLAYSLNVSNFQSWASLKLGARSFFQVSCGSVGAQVLGPSSTAFPST